MEKIKVILEKIDNLFLEGKKWGTLKKNTKIRIGPKQGAPRGSKTFVTVPKGAPLEVTIYGRGTYNVVVIDGEFDGLNLSSNVGTGTDEIDYKKMKQLHKKYSPSYPLTDDDLVEVENNVRTNRERKIGQRIKHHDNKQGKIDNKINRLRKQKNSSEERETRQRQLKSKHRDTLSRRGMI